MPERDELSLLPIGQDDYSPLPPEMRECARTLYRQAWTAYRKVGCPYGESDEAMLVWYTLHGDDRGPSLITGKN